MEDKIFKTHVVNIEKLHDNNFLIPNYQRPYVWGEEQIKKLLDDIYKSFKSKDKSIYYAGTILTKDNENDIEIIDGQQRLTTLWLTAFTLSRKKESKLESFLKNNNNKTLKLEFEIRSEVGDYFNQLLEKDKENNFNLIESSEIIKYPYLENIVKALATINGFVDSLPDEDLSDLSNYIYEKVCLVKNTTPPNTDLNKLFSTINSTGIQLEQTDILKSNLLRIIDDKVLYSKIWEVCENMNNFFERNVRISFSKTKFLEIDFSKYVEFDKSIFLYEFSDSDEVENDENDFLIDNIVKERVKEYEVPSESDQKEDRLSDEIYCRSIINFGQLLLHTYRLHLKKERKNDFDGTFHVNRLNEIFKSLELRNDQEEVKRFFLLLWKVRYLFDKYVVKWISDVETKTDFLELTSINKGSENYYTRGRYGKSSMLMLQSVLYYTGDYLRQFWITTYLGYLLENHANNVANSDILLLKLEQIDNDLSLCKTLTDKDASFKLLDNSIDTNFDIESYLNEHIGTKYQHYWFQKLEYILWKNNEIEKTKEFENYRIVSRNSIEHIYPQNPENQIKHPKIEEEFLHSFGNLVLLNVMQNSEYSNKSVDEKKSIFRNKQNTYDTLKSYYIFQFYSNWTGKEIENHLKDMVEKIRTHYHIDN